MFHLYLPGDNNTCNTYHNKFCDYKNDTFGSGQIIPCLIIYHVHAIGWVCKRIGKCIDKKMNSMGHNSTMLLSKQIAILYHNMLDIKAVTYYYPIYDIIVQVVF